MKSHTLSFNLDALWIVIRLFVPGFAAMLALVFLVQTAFAAPETPATIQLDGYATNGIVSGNSISITGGEFAVGMAIYPFQKGIIHAKVSYAPGGTYSNPSYNYVNCQTTGNVISSTFRGFVNGYLTAEILVDKYINSGITFFECNFIARLDSTNPFTVSVQEASQTFVYSELVTVTIASPNIEPVVIETDWNESDQVITLTASFPDGMSPADLNNGIVEIISLSGGYYNVPGTWWQKVTETTWQWVFTLADDIEVIRIDTNNELNWLTANGWTNTDTGYGIIRPVLPEIDLVTPSSPYPGAKVVLTGRRFLPIRPGKTVTDLKLFLSLDNIGVGLIEYDNTYWQNNRIEFTLPANFRSGQVYCVIVQRGGENSNQRCFQTSFANFMSLIYK